MNVGRMSKGKTRSYIPMGTMAREDPLVEVVNRNFLPGSSLDR